MNSSSGFAKIINLKKNKEEIFKKVNEVRHL
jgi:hypothetical protein